MKRLVVAVCLSSGVATSGALASDYSVKGSIGETLTGSDNYFLLKSPAGTTFQSLTAGTLNFLRRTPDTRLLLDTNFSVYDYFGSGASDTSPRVGTPAGARFQADHTTEINKYTFAASWYRDDLATTQLRETGVVTTRGLLDAYSASGGVTHDVSRTDAIGLSAQGRTVTFTGSTQSPYKDVSTALNWSHIFDPTTSLNTSASVDWFDADDPANSRRLFWQIVTSLQTQLTRRLSFNGSIGGGFSNTYQNALAPTTTQFQRGTTGSVQAYAGLSYQLLKTTSVSLTAGHAIVPTTFGPIETISTVGISLRHNINDVSSLSFATQFAYTDFAGVSSNLFSAQVAYGYALTRQLRSSLSYTYRQRDDSTGFANSSTVLLGLNYDFSLYGNPTALDERAAEVERARLRQRAVQAFPGLL